MKKSQRVSALLFCLFAILMLWSGSVLALEDCHSDQIKVYDGWEEEKLYLEPDLFTDTQHLEWGTKVCQLDRKKRWLTTWFRVQTEDNRIGWLDEVELFDESDFLSRVVNRHGEQLDALERLLTRIVELESKLSQYDPDALDSNRSVRNAVIAQLDIATTLTVPTNAFSMPTTEEEAKIPVMELDSVGPSQDTTTYYIRAGDTLLKVAAAHDIELVELLELNPQITNPNNLSIGTALQVPAAEEEMEEGSSVAQCPTPYTVAEGDTLFTIADAHGVNAGILALVNNMTVTDELEPGHLLCIPAVPAELEAVNTPTPTSSPNTTAVAEKQQFGSGAHQVPEAIKPGLYYSEDPPFICYWARLSGFSGELNDIISNGVVSHPDLVQIKISDKGFESNGCGTWTEVPADEKLPVERNPWHDGAYRVGLEIEPGTYRSLTTGLEGCYWERLSNFTGEIDAVITNGFSESPTIVRIESSDIGFRSNGCGGWEQIE